jgi:hypothetical protein
MGKNQNKSVARLDKAIARRRINQISKVTENVILGIHARERMVERDIVVSDLYRVLRNGFVDDDGELTDQGEWKYKVTLKMASGREIGAVTIIVHDQKLFVMTVEWEDL